MQVVKKNSPQTSYSTPALMYVVIDRKITPSAGTMELIRKAAENIAELWVVRIDDELDSVKRAKTYPVGTAGTISMSRGELLRRMSGWANASKPDLIIPFDMLRYIEPSKARIGRLMAYRTISGLHEFLEERNQYASQSRRDAQLSDTSPRVPLAPHGLTLFDIKRPTNTEMQRFLAKWHNTALTRPAFLQLLNDAAVLYSVPVNVLVQLTKWEFYGLKPQNYTSAFMGGYNGHYAGPFQIGYNHYLDTRRLFAPQFGVSIPADRRKASLGVQVASIIDYVRRAANVSKTLARSPMTAVGFYLVHNQGPGGAIKIIRNQLDATTRKNLKAQSAEVKAALKSTYGVSV